jgi:hypothetical protein
MRPAVRSSLLLILLAVFPRCSAESSCDPLPGSNLRARIESRLGSEQGELSSSLGHRALIYPVAQTQLHRFMQQIHPRHDGPDIVMAAAGGIELHGGAVLELIASLWRPGGRPAALADAFPFASIDRVIPLRQIYDSMRMQLFLPIPGIATEEISGRLPTSPQLPKTRMLTASPRGLVASELDAYNALKLLLRYEDDLHAPWTNRLGQQLTAASLLDDTWIHFLALRSAEEEFSDHGYLHLPEILLTYNRRLKGVERRDPNELKHRLLSVELKRDSHGGYDASEALGHYTESLGHLLSEPGVTWTATERGRVCTWIRAVETVHMSDIGSTPAQHLAHMLRGLRMIEEHTSRLR